jgi:transcriptional regulator with XRE-family HTH domain
VRAGSSDFAGRISYTAQLVTGQELSDALRGLGWSAHELGRRLGVTESTIRNWLSGRREVPASVAEWLTELQTGMAKLPSLPRGWRVDT